MKIDPNNSKHIMADKGKSLYRKFDNSGPFKEIILGTYRYGYILKNETVSDFVEKEDNINND